MQYQIDEESSFDTEDKNSVGKGKIKKVAYSYMITIAVSLLLLSMAGLLLYLFDLEKINSVRAYLDNVYLFITAAKGTFIILMVVFWKRMIFLSCLINKNIEKYKGFLLAIRWHVFYMLLSIFVVLDLRLFGLTIK